jgi:hypothetical protein
MDSVKGLCDPNENPLRNEMMAAGNLTCITSVFQSCGDDCFSIFEGIITHIFVLELIVNLAVAESYFSRRVWTGRYDKDTGELLETVTPNVPFFLDLTHWIDIASILPFYLGACVRACLRACLRGIN